MTRSNNKDSIDIGQAPPEPNESSDLPGAAGKPKSYDELDRRELERIIDGQKAEILLLTKALESERSGRKQLAAALWESEEKFFNLMNEAPVGVRIWDLEKDGRLIFAGANKAADEILGVDHRLLVGKTIEESFPASARTVIPERYKKIADEGGSWHNRQIYYDGPDISGVFDVHAFRLSPLRMAAMFYDLTNRNQTESSRTADQVEIIRTPDDAPLPAEPISGIKEAVNGQDNGPAKTTLSMGRHFRTPRNIKYTDLFSLDELQRIQDAFSNATNLGSIITSPDGRPITRPSNFCRLCKDFVRNTPKGAINCMRSDAIIGAPNRSGPIVQKCFSTGIWDGGASICVGDNHVASWLIGQVRDETVDEATVIQYAAEIGAPKEEFREAFYQIPYMPHHQFLRICEMLFLFTNQMSELALQNILQGRALVARQDAEKALRQSQTRLQHLSSRLIMAQEEERKQLAAELHDGVGQSLTAAKYCVDSVIQNKFNPRLIEESLPAASDMIKTVIRDVRRMQAELRPQVLDDFGIVATINWFCREFQRIYFSITVEKIIEIEESTVTDLRLKPVIYRIMQEAMNNTAKHSRAERVTIKITQNMGRIILSIQDDGIGFEVEKALALSREKGTLGLDSMRERAELANGTLEIKSSPGQGAKITGSWPMSG